MDAPVRSLIARLHDAPYSYVLAVTGGGAGVAAWLLSVPGGSRTLLEVAIPYNEQALSDFLGQRPDSFCTVETADLMARRALERARWLSPGSPVAGIACTASLRSDRPKRGEHRFHLAIQTAEHTTAYSLTLTKEARTREEEELVLDRVLLNAMAEAFGVTECVAVPLLAGETIVSDARSSSEEFAAFLVGKTPTLCVQPDGQMRRDGPRPAVLLPGSFNPLHTGHCTLAEAAGRRLGAPAAYELTILNADKGLLAAEEVRRRLAQFGWGAAVWLTRAPTFPEKAHLFPGTAFVIGADTASRIVQPRFYGDLEARMNEALEALRSRGCRFLVAGRVNAEGRFLGLEDLDIPALHRDLFTALPASEFRVDLSSTQLRAVMNG